MARGDMTILDMSIDHADKDALLRINAKFELGVSAPKWWHRTAPFREQVREALREKWREES